jgi:L-asparaginase/Glu-tRNA(Gln) amidotransferase subunit D
MELETAVEIARAIKVEIADGACGVVVTQGTGHD